MKVRTTYTFLIAECGKSAFMEQFISEEFLSEWEPTLGANVRTYTVTAQNANVTLDIWDTSGQEALERLIPLFCNAVHTFLFMYDITKYENND